MDKRVIGSPSSYVYKHWYEATDDSDDTLGVEKHDTNNHILSSIMDIFNTEIGNTEAEDDLLSSIYQDILNPVIKETVKRKNHLNTKYKKTLTRNKNMNEKESMKPVKRIFSTMLTPRTQEKVEQGISTLVSSIPHYQALLQYVVYIIGGTVVLSLPALG